MTSLPPDKPTQPQNIRAVLEIYSLLVSISAFVTALIIFLIPSEPGNEQFLGLSYQRWILIGSAFLPGVLMALFAFKVYRDETWAKNIWSGIVGNQGRLQHVVQFSALGFLGGWLVSFTPAYVFADYKDYYFRLSPLLYWFTFVSGITLAIALKEKYGFHWPSLLNSLRAQRQTLTVSFISLSIFIFIWILITSTGLGIRIVEDYWYGAGVPILGIQVVIAFAIGLGVLLYKKSSFIARFPVRFDLLIFVVIWIAAAFFWIREPLPDSFFASGPYPPNFEYYPYSDASVFDLGSQFVLIGQGINNGAPFDRVLYMGFLVFLHLIGGQNYLRVIALQVGVYAILPAIFYLLGREIHSRTFGIILAVLAILRGINGIAASNMIDLANQKQMLTDFPMLIFVAWFALMLVKWLKAPGKNYSYILWAGGAMGFAMMVRTHAIFLLAFAIVLILGVYRSQKTRGILVSFLLILAMSASILPWGIQNGSGLFEVFKSRIQQRYFPFLSPATPTPAPQGGTLPGFSIESGEPGLVADHRFHSYSRAASGGKFEIQSWNEDARSLSLYSSIATNFFHNLITSVLTLPTSLVFDDLRHTLKEGAPFWRQYWDGDLGIGAGLFLAINLILISLGIGISWKFAGKSGLVLLGIFIFYNLANAVARTSGGRYIVPADWIVFFYFSLGLLQAILWGGSLFGLQDGFETGNLTYEQPEDSAWTWKPLKSAPWILIVFLFFGSLLPWSEHLFPKRYSVQSETKLLAMLEQEGYLKEMGFSKAAISSFAKEWPVDFSITYGRALYPRFFLENKGLPKNQYPYGVLQYPRLGFTLIDSRGVSFVVLPQDQMSYFPNASDVIVLGCKNVNIIDALAVVVVAEKTVVYTRQPASPLECPLQEPVCGDDHACR
jgi:hypothetical protein